MSEVPFVPSWRLLLDMERALIDFYTQGLSYYSEMFSRRSAMGRGLNRGVIERQVEEELFGPRLRARDIEELVEAHTHDYHNADTTAPNRVILRKVGELINEANNIRMELPRHIQDQIRVHLPEIEALQGQTREHANPEELPVRERLLVRMREQGAHGLEMPSINERRAVFFERMRAIELGRVQEEERATPGEEGKEFVDRYRGDVIRIPPPAAPSLLERMGEAAFRHFMIMLMRHALMPGGRGLRIMDGGAGAALHIGGLGANYIAHLLQMLRRGELPAIAGPPAHRAGIERIMEGVWAAINPNNLLALNYLSEEFKGNRTEEEEETRTHSIEETSKPDTPKPLKREEAPLELPEGTIRRPRSKPVEMPMDTEELPTRDELGRYSKRLISTEEGSLYNEHYRDRFDERLPPKKSPYESYKESARHDEPREPPDTSYMNKLTEYIFGGPTPSPRRPPIYNKEEEEEEKEMGEEQQTRQQQPKRRRYETEEEAAVLPPPSQRMRRTARTLKVPSKQYNI